MKHFKVFVEMKVHHYLGRLKKKECLPLLEVLDSLGEHYHGRSNYSELGKNGRMVDVCIIGKHAIHYWINNSDEHVIVLEITSAGS